MSSQFAGCFGSKWFSLLLFLKELRLMRVLANENSDWQADFCLESKAGHGMRVS